MAIISKIIEVSTLSAGAFHLQPKQTLDTMQCAKIVVEMLVLIHFAGFTEYLTHYFQKAYGLEPN